MPVKTISCPEDVKEFLDKLPNASKFVVELVRREMIKESRNEVVTKKEVEEMIMKFMKVSEGIKIRIGNNG